MAYIFIQMGAEKTNTTIRTKQKNVQRKVFNLYTYGNMIG